MYLKILRLYNPYVFNQICNCSLVMVSEKDKFRLIIEIQSNKSKRRCSPCQHLDQAFSWPSLHFWPEKNHYMISFIIIKNEYKKLIKYNCKLYWVYLNTFLPQNFCHNIKKLNLKTKYTVQHKKNKCKKTKNMPQQMDNKLCALTKTLTGNPFFLKTSTTLLPTPPVAPATRMIPEVSIGLTGSLGAGPVNFSTRKSKNFKFFQQKFVYMSVEATKFTPS